MSLSWPQFIGISAMINRLRIDAAIDNMFLPYGAAKYGGQCADQLFERRGSYYLEVPDEYVEPSYTPEELSATRARVEAIRQAHERLAIDTINQSNTNQQSIKDDQQ